MSLPKREVKRTLLEGGRTSLLSLIHVLGTPVREFSVVRKARDSKVHIASGLVTMAGLDELGDQLDNAIDRLASQRLCIRTTEAQTIRVFEIGIGHPLRKLVRGL
jgi:hypothetical protein